MHIILPMNNNSTFIEGNRGWFFSVLLRADIEQNEPRSHQSILTLSHRERAQKPPKHIRIMTMHHLHPHRPCHPPHVPIRIIYISVIFLCGKHAPKVKHYKSTANARTLSIGKKNNCARVNVNSAVFVIFYMYVLVYMQGINNMGRKKYIGRKPQNRIEH